MLSILTVLPPINSRKKSIYRSRAAERPNRTADCTGSAARESRSPPVNTLHRKPGARKSVRDRQTDPLRGKTVNRCWQRGAVSAAVNNALAGGRQGALSSHSVRVLSFRPRRPYPLRLASTAGAGPELTLPASMPAHECCPTPAEP